MQRNAEVPVLIYWMDLQAKHRLQQQASCVGRAVHLMRQGLGRRSGTERGNERERVREERGEREGMTIQKRVVKREE